MYRSTILFVCVIFFASSCQTDFMEEELPQNIEADIQTELIPYFQTFRDQASEHGLTIDYQSANVTARIEQINEGSVAGTCSTNGHNIRDIIIDKAFWERSSNLIREMIIFHELGHCVLGRGHEEGAFENGICRSIMRSGLGNCRDAYNAENRDYFIEELFGNEN